VLSALAAAPDVWRHGYDLGREIGLKAGTLYPPAMVREHAVADVAPAAVTKRRRSMPAVIAKIPAVAPVLADRAAHHEAARGRPAMRDAP
jgi:hypothetical protein